MNQRRRFTPLSLLLLAATVPAICAFATGCQKSHAAEAPAGPPAGEAWLTAQQIKEGNVAYTAVGEETVDDTLVTSGRVTFDDQRVAHIFSPVNGRVVRVDALLGAHVKRGSSLAVIQSPDIGLASSDVGKAKADLFAAERYYEVQKDLATKGATSQKDLEISEDNFRKAKAEMGRATQKANLLRAGGAAASDVSQGYTLITPLEGEVTMKNVSPGVEIQGQYGGGTPAELFTVGDVGRVWVIADVFESDLARVRVGAKAAVTIVANPGKHFDGKVEWISGVLDASTRSAKVRCAFDNPDGQLKPEMYATARIAVEERKALALPRSALVRLGDQTIVFVHTGTLADGREKFERVPVTIDDVEGSKFVPVLYGLEKGAKVVTEGAARLQAAM